MAEQDWPECLKLWQCVGCGAMGNSEPCAGACDFKRILVVDAERHAELLDYFLTLAERRECLRAFARDVAIACETEQSFAATSESLRERGRKLVRTSPERVSPPPAVAQDERHELWLCASCGQVEAPRECLGICIRRNGDFVRAVDHDALNDRIARARPKTQKLATLARQVGWSAARHGQSERMRGALRVMARELVTAV